MVVTGVAQNLQNAVLTKVEVQELQTVVVIEVEVRDLQSAVVIEEVQDLDVKDRVQDLDVKDQVPDLDVEDQVQDLDVKAHTQDLDVKDHAQDLDVRDRTQDLDVRDHTQDLDVKDHTQDVAEEMVTSTEDMQEDHGVLTSIELLQEITDITDTLVVTTIDGTEVTTTGDQFLELTGGIAGFYTQFQVTPWATMFLMATHTMCTTVTDTVTHQLIYVITIS